MARPTQAWLDRAISTRNTELKPQTTGWRAILKAARYTLSGRTRATEAADARRAARCDEANEPKISSVAKQTTAAIDTLTIPAFVPSGTMLDADARAPSWNPDMISPTISATGRKAAAANGLQDLFKAAVGKFAPGTLAHGEEQRRPRRLVMRDPSFTSADRVPANAPHDAFAAPNRKQAAR